MNNLFTELEQDDLEKASPSKGGFFFIHALLERTVKITGFFALLSVLVASSFISYDYARTRSAFPSRTFIGNLEITNLTRTQAIAKLKSFSVAEIFAPLVTLESDTNRFTFAPQALGIQINPEQSIDLAFKLTHNENYFVELKDRVIKGIEYAPLVLDINESDLRPIIEEIAIQVSSSPKDASILLNEDTGGYHVETEQLGRELDIVKNLENFKAAIFAGKTIVPLVVQYEYPTVRERDLRAHPPVTRLSAYTTYYGRHDSPNRIHNIKLVASWINNTLLMPGDIFSVVEAIGDVTKERGFKEAYVIMGGELVPLLGGGSCQIATTLYNSVMLADLKVLQRRNHSFYFNIYPLGRDAGVYPGQLDFRFQNDTGYPVLIKSVATNMRLSFRLYGTPSGKTVEISNASVLGLARNGYEPMSLGTVIKWDIPFKTSVVRTVYNKDGNKIKEETITSAYKLYGEKTNVPIRRPESR